jgi:hypothetical protein
MFFRFNETDNPRGLVGYDQENEADYRSILNRVWHFLKFS